MGGVSATTSTRPTRASVSTPTTRRGRDRLVLAVIALTALTGVLSLWHLGGRSLWLDESVSTTLARASWSRFAHIVRVREANMSGYYLVLRAWSGLGHSDAFLRGLSVLAAVALVPLLYALARRLGGSRVAVTTGLLLALNPLYVHYAQEARGYALCLLFVTLASYLFVRGMQGSWTWPIGGAYAIAIGLAATANLFAVLVPVAHAVSLAFLPRERVPWRSLGLTATATAVLLAPWGLFIQSTNSAGVNWASGSAAAQVLTRVRDAAPRPVMLLALVVGVAVLAWLFARLRRSSRGAAIVSDWPIGFAAAWLVVPVVSVILLSLVYKPLLVIRYLTVAIPGAALLPALLLDRLPRRALANAGVVVLLALSAVGVQRWYANGQAEDWRHAAAYVQHQVAAGDGVVWVPPYVRVPFEWYLRAPSARGALQPVFPSYPWGGDPLKALGDVPLHPADVQRLAAGHQRVWLVLSHDDLYGNQDPRTLDARHALETDGFRVTGDRRFTGVRVVTYSR